MLEEGRNQRRNFQDWTLDVKPENQERKMEKPMRPQIKDYERWERKKR